MKHVITTYSFGSCVLVKTTRELWLGPSAQVLPPLVFELLLYLIENRHKVVTRFELIEKLWRNADVTDNAVSRAVGKARLAIGDNGLDVPCIRTVHRVGYRFVAAVVDGFESPRVAAHRMAEASPQQEGQLRVAVLPLENRTGDARMDWVGLGLMTLVSKAFEGAVGVRVESAASVLQWLEITPADATLEERAILVGKLGALDRTLCARVLRHGSSYGIDYRLIGRTGTLDQGLLKGADLGQLAQEFGRSIEAALRAG